MPTKNPRINITVKPERYELLKRLAGFQGTSMSALVAETMEMIYPVMERVCVVLEAAQRAQESSKEGLRESIARAEEELLPLLYQAVGQFDLFVEDASKAVGVQDDSATHAETLIRDIMEKNTSGPGAPRVAARAAARGVAGTTADPRLVIRGSGSPKKGR